MEICECEVKAPESPEDYVSTNAKNKTMDQSENSPMDLLITEYFFHLLEMPITKLWNQ